jgi:hypothetical protein
MTSRKPRKCSCQRCVFCLLKGELDPTCDLCGGTGWVCRKKNNLHWTPGLTVLDPGVSQRTYCKLEGPPPEKKQDLSDHDPAIILARPIEEWEWKQLDRMLREQKMLVKRDRTGRILTYKYIHPATEELDERFEDDPWCDKVRSEIFEILGWLDCWDENGTPPEDNNE